MNCVSLDQVIKYLAGTLVINCQNRIKVTCREVEQPKDRVFVSEVLPVLVQSGHQCSPVSFR